MEKQESCSRKVLILLIIVFVCLGFTQCTKKSNKQPIDNTQSEIKNEVMALLKKSHQAINDTLTVTQLKDLSAEIFRFLQNNELEKYPDFKSQLLLTQDSLKSATIKYVKGTTTHRWLDNQVVKEVTKEYYATFDEYLVNPEKYSDQINEITITTSSYETRAKKLFDKYGWDKETCMTVAQRKISIGMNKEQVTAAWGRPDDINKTITDYGIHEQWCYGSIDGSYVYFEDGVVTTIQN